MASRFLWPPFLARRYSPYTVVKLNMMSNDIVNTIVSTCGLFAQPRVSFHTVAKPQAGTKARLGGLGMLSRWAEIVVCL